MNRRTFMKSLGLTAAAAALAPRALATEDPRRPNIVFIMADDLGYGHIGPYGQDKIKTPSLDRMAKEGTKFTQAYAGCPLCAASRSVLMTGLHAGHTPVRGNSGGVPLRQEDVTIAEVLQQAGYNTGLFGKWGLGEAYTSGAPNKQGFDEFFGTLHQKHSHFYYTDYLWHNDERYPLPGNMNGQRTQYTHDVVLEKCLDWLQADREEPFFCFLSLTIPHHEWTVPEDSVAPYRGQWEEDPPKYRWREGYAFPDAPKANMAGMITRMDAGVGKVLDALEAKGIAEDTLVIFTSDNGPDRYSLACADFFNARGGLRGYKYDMYEGGLRVPTIAWWPGKVPSGATSDYPWHFADVFPTFAALAGVKDAPETDGDSVVPALLGETANTEERMFYWESGENRALRLGDWKIVQNSEAAPIELYNLATDFTEEKDVAQENAALVERLKSLMDAQHEAPPPQVEPSAPDGRYYR